MGLRMGKAGRDKVFILRSISESRRARMARVR